ncbi:cysteine/glutathione ABC transporter membrane/ATP-binding component [compost metagenome]
MLLLDEPTAHLDAGSAREMMAILRSGLKDVTIVLVTHNPEDIDPADARLELPAVRSAVKRSPGAAELEGRPTAQ